MNFLADLFLMLPLENATEHKINWLHFAKAWFSHCRRQHWRGRGGEWEGAGESHCFYFSLSTYDSGLYWKCKLALGANLVQNSWTRLSFIGSSRGRQYQTACYVWVFIQLPPTLSTATTNEMLSVLKLGVEDFMMHSQETK